MWLSKIADPFAQWSKRKREYSSSDGNCAFCELKAFCETASFRVTVLCFMNYLKGEQRLRKSKQQPQNCCKEVKNFGS